MPDIPTTDLQAEFDSVLRVWERAQIIDRGPSMGRPGAQAALENIAARPKDFHDLLVASLSHPSQIVVGYCLLALDQMQSTALRNLPPELLTRRDQISIHLGSFRQSMDLGGLARQLNKKWKNQVANP